jgi:hypothetical protein
MVEHKSSICQYPGCSYFADFTQRFTEEGDPEHWASHLIVVGARQYQARCELHHQVPGKIEAQILIKYMQESGKEAIPEGELEFKSNSESITGQNYKWILDTLEREKKILRRDNQIIPNYPALDR